MPGEIAREPHRQINRRGVGQRDQVAGDLISRPAPAESLASQVALKQESRQQSRDSRTPHQAKNQQSSAIGHGVQQHFAIKKRAEREG